MENGHDWKIAEKFSGLTVSAAADHHLIPPSTTFAAAAATANNNHHQDSSLMQVMKAMEAAEATIKQQVEENIRLRTQLEHKMLELHRYKLHGSHQIDGPPETQLGGGGAAVSTTTSVSPERSSTEGEYSANGGGFMMPVAVSDSNKKDLVVKVNEHEQEIMQLRKRLADFSVKEGQIRNEKYALEKRIAYMRLAFDQQQQDLADATSKALSYRQDIIEQNIRLAYAVQDAQQERTTFVSSLLPILAEYSLQPPVPDAQSIVGNVKVLFRHLQEKLLLTEGKLKELQYQLTPWRSDTNQQQQSRNSISAPQSPLPDSVGGAALLNVSRNGLEMVAQNQEMYASRAPVSSSDALTTMDWGPSGFGGGGVTNNVHNDMMGRYSPVPSSTSGLAQDVPVNHVVAQGDTRENHNSEGTSNRQVRFLDPVRHPHRDIDDQDAEGNHNERDSSNWSAGTSPFASPLNAHYLAPVLEEGSSSYSEAADDDPLPAIENLQISGEAFPGHELQACGYSINGTTSCNFEWVRHLQDGSVNYIDGAKQPNYLVTADDVDTYLAIEVQPLDNRKRKGELVKVFANEHNKITCDPEMQGQIEKTLYKGQASFKVFQFTGYLDIWEPATLAIKRGAYSIKCSGGGPSGSSVVVAEKFLPNTMVTIPYGSPTEFIILSGSDGGGEYLLRAENESCSRDTVVLLLRFFIHKADERKNTRKAKIGSYFFNKYL